MRPEPGEPAWWRDAVFYQVYVRSFADSDGDGVGDLEGIHSRLGYLELLGVDALWLTPFYRSPMADHGYDIADPRDVDPMFGTLGDFDVLLTEAHKRNIKVTVDVVPNHTSNQHAWFKSAMAAEPGSPERERYIFRDGVGPRGEDPPNNWVSAFGGPAWTRVPDGQWYLHLFAPQQPDLNWANPEVAADLERTLRFWLERGVDGFRIDVAHGMAKPPGLPDMDPRADALGPSHYYDPRWDYDGVHEIHQMIRKVLDEFPEAMAVGEIWVTDEERLSRYLRPDELHLAFNFRLVLTHFDADAMRTAIQRSLTVPAKVGAPATWTLSNHDVWRQVSRYGGGATGRAPGAGDGAGRAGAARHGLPVQRRRAGPGERGHPAFGDGGPAREDQRGRVRPRRLPGAAAVGGRPAAVRLLPQPAHVAADAGRVGRADGREADRGRGLDAFAVPAGDRAAEDPLGVRRRRAGVVRRARGVLRVPPQGRRAGVRAEHLGEPDRAAAG